MRQKLNLAITLQDPEAMSRHMAADPLSYAHHYSPRESRHSHSAGWIVSATLEVIKHHFIHGLDECFLPDKQQHVFSASRSNRIQY
jgi:hypothetical protein